MSKTFDVLGGEWERVVHPLAFGESQTVFQRKTLKVRCHQCGGGEMTLRPAMVARPNSFYPLFGGAQVICSAGHLETFGDEELPPSPCVPTCV